MSLPLGLVTIAIMAILARRAERELALEHARLPMQFALNGAPIWDAPRRVALWFMPALALVIFAPLALIWPDTLGALIAALSLLGGQLFYHHLIARWS